LSRTDSAALLNTHLPLQQSSLAFTLSQAMLIFEQDKKLSTLHTHLPLQQSSHAFNLFQAIYIFEQDKKIVDIKKLSTLHTHLPLPQQSPQQSTTAG
jgi:hypothetical protein